MLRWLTKNCEIIIDFIICIYYNVFEIFKNNVVNFTFSIDYIQA